MDLASAYAIAQVDRSEAILTHSCASYLFISLVQLGSTTVGIQTSEGVVLGVEKRVQSPLLESSSIEKIMEIDSHIGCAMSGLTADARTMVEHARVTAQVGSYFLLLAD